MFFNFKHYIYLLYINKTNNPKKIDHLFFFIIFFSTFIVQFFGAEKI